MTLYSNQSKNLNSGIHLRSTIYFFLFLKRSTTLVPIRHYSEKLTKSTENWILWGYGIIVKNVVTTSDTCKNKVRLILFRNCKVRIGK